MARRRIALGHRKQRSVLTDMLPFEVPPTFSNRGYYRFLRDNGVEIEGGRVRWLSGPSTLDVVMRLLFGIKAGTSIDEVSVSEWGKPKVRRSVSLGNCRMDTIPFNFKVAHKLDGRVLSVVHPRNQVDVASFYANHAALIIYYASISEFSIRRPVSVARYTFFKDRLHQQVLEKATGGIEVDDREYEQLGSYFVYRKYRNIHRFFESYKYHRSEKKYDAMVQIDVNKCFDSIYTHSIAWAVIGKAQTKFNLDGSKGTFAGKFDLLMQRLNHKETNGIVIGPEFSRIFAEIILQSVDKELETRLLEGAKLIHKVDYEMFRYVDDYFVFYNEKSTPLKILETLQDLLRSKKLSINTAKIKHYEKPIITEITVAKERISSLLNDEIDPRVEEKMSFDASGSTALELVCETNSNRLIIRYKTIIKESHVEYADLLNYTLSIAESKLEKLFKAYDGCGRAGRDQKRLLKAILSVMEFSFFIYSASPKVNHTIRICRMIATSVRALHENKIPYELKHLHFKYVHDNLIQQLNKNTISSHREVESLYLLVSLSQVGKEYWLPEATLAKYFLIEADGSGGYSRQEFLSHFSITVFLSYIKEKVRYKKLRIFMEEHVKAKLSHKKAHCPNDAEALMLFLDLAVCPYITDATKTAIAAIFDLNVVNLAALQAANDHWFTAWGDKFDLSKELDAKRSREVY